MIQGQYDPSSGQKCTVAQQTPQTPRTNRLLQQYPVLFPVGLLSASIGLCIVSFFVNTLFPVLAIIGTPSALVCLLIAFVSGIAGVLASIISIIENVDRIRPAWFSKLKKGA